MSRRILATHLELPPHNDVSTMGLMQKRTLKSPIYPSSCVVLVLDHPCTTVLATGNRNQTSTFATHSQQNNKYDDSELIRSIFGVEFDAQSKTFVRCKDPGKPVFDVQQHWFKVQHIEGPIYSHRDQKRKSSIHGTLVPVFGAPRPRPHPPQPQEDQSSSELPGDSRVRLDFYLEDADIARLVHKGNNLGVLCPIVHKPPENTNGGGTEQRHTATVLEYGSQSILFAVQTSDDTDDAEEEESSSDCGKANLSQLPAKKHHDGFFHFDKHVECPDLDAITPNIKHICLYGTVVLVSGNAPVETNGRVGDRYGLRIRNDKGQEADITLWDELGLAVAKMLPGQKVLIGNLVSELYKNKCFISGGLDKGTYIYNISTFTSIISSPDLRDIHYISTLSPNGATSSYCVKAVVVDVVVNTHPSHYNDAEAACLVRDRRDLVGATYLIRKHPNIGTHLYAENLISQNVDLKLARPYINALYSKPGFLLDNTCKHPVKLDVGNWKEYVTTSQRLKGPVDSFPFQCLSCRLEKIPGHDVVASYSLRFKIDDGSSHIVVESSTDSSMEIIGIPPSLFLSSAALDSQLDALYRVVGCEFLFGLESLSNIVKATNKSSKSKIDYRIDTALQASNPSSGIVRLLPGSPKK
ncbi:hypothetical protein H4219_002794 [Mycoemilia scoparia]|uniref:Cell division control protein 24 OB domain-containing protein n=1 Tax=Mycoemilia scoparia TaxID=417184 RepID=A0A9W8DNP3_9FUNG|nr:hypothetical protein H4219_002794 [Mycoemilia scoparia]